MANLTELLRAVGTGEQQAVNELLGVMYAELREVARASLRKSPRLTALDTTALVHESYMRFVKAGRLEIADRAHFLAYAARVMRSVIIDLVRQRRAERHGGGAMRVTLNTAAGANLEAGEDQLLRIDEVLADLSKTDPRLVQVIEMRYFAGFSEAEIAGLLGVTERTVRRDWSKARLLLRAALA